MSKNKKRVNIAARPTARPVSQDEWVGEGSAQDEQLAGTKAKAKRLTIDIPESLHRTIKSQCAGRGTKMADEIRELLLQKYGNQ